MVAHRILWFRNVAPWTPAYRRMCVGICSTGMWKQAFLRSTVSICKGVGWNIPEGSLGSVPYIGAMCRFYSSLAPWPPGVAQFLARFCSLPGIRCVPGLLGPQVDILTSSDRLLCWVHFVSWTILGFNWRVLTLEPISTCPVWIPFYL